MLLNALKHAKCVSRLLTGLFKLEDDTDPFKTQGMFIKAVEEDPWQLKDAPDHFKSQEMCSKAVRDYLFSL